jgi:glucosamine-phosphate N-acetyltransferase
MIIRNLNINDYNKYISLINISISKEKFDDFINNVLGELHIIYVLEKDNEIIGTGTLYIEKKLTYNISKMGHIENIFINKYHRGNGYGEKIVNKLLEYAKNKKCYRVDLTCIEELIPFYNKNNFTTKNVSMNILFKENFN